MPRPTILVSVDMMAAHCAGALGHPLLLLVPYSPHWAWGIGRERTPWYPTARLFRQPARCKWVAPIRAVAEMLPASAQQGLRFTNGALAVNLY